MKRHFVAGRWDASGRATRDLAAVCCDGTCEQGRRCPLNPARVEAAKPRPPVRQRAWAPDRVPLTPTERAIVWSVGLYCVGLAGVLLVGALVAWWPQ